MEAKQRVDLPAIGEQTCMGRTRNLIAEEADKGVAGVEVRVAVVTLEVVVVLRESTAICGDLVEVVAPGVDGRTGEMMPVL